MQTPKQIKRVHSLAELKRYAALGTEPVVYRLAPEERFPAHEKWTPEYLETLEVEVGVHRNSRPSFFDLKNSSALELAQSALKYFIPLKDLIRARRREGNDDVVEYEMISGTDTHLYLENGVVPRWKSLWEDVSGLTRDIPDDAPLQRVGFWVSGGHGKLASQLHWDVNGHHNLNYQVVGKKRIIMFPPSDSEFLYPMPARLFHLSRIDPREWLSSTKEGSSSSSHVKTSIIHDEAYPLVANAHPHVTDLEAGDVLLIPSKWWHHVSHLGELNVNATAWYYSKEHSGTKFKWRDVMVANPLEAWMREFFFSFATGASMSGVRLTRHDMRIVVGKLILAIAVFMPALLVVKIFVKGERISGKISKSY